MAKPQKIQIDDTSGGERLDKFLLKIFNQQTRTQIQKMIGLGQIKVNGKQPSKHKFLKTGDIIEILPAAAEPTEQNQDLPLVDILASQEDYIIVNKPPGLVVHADTSHKLENTLAGQLIQKYPELEGIGEDATRPGIVHRLDKGVSGVMVIARSKEGYKNLKQQFQRRKVNKTYEALVHGVIEKNNISLDFPIIRKKDGYMASLPIGASGRESLTHLNIIKRYRKYSHIKINIVTGRTHQIRTHLNAYQHPIVGEHYYISKKFKKDLLQKNIKRIFLHSNKI